MNTRTLPHPRHNSHVIDPRARDDQMLGKGYMPSPSPALPLDGSYYNMNSDRYLSYPPMVKTLDYLYNNKIEISPTTNSKTNEQKKTFNHCSIPGLSKCGIFNATTANDSHNANKW